MMILIETRSQNNTSIDECDFVMSNINEEKKKKKTGMYGWWERKNAQNEDVSIENNEQMILYILFMMHTKWVL